MLERVTSRAKISFRKDKAYNNANEKNDDHMTKVVTIIANLFMEELHWNEIEVRREHSRQRESMTKDTDC